MADGRLPERSEDPLDAAALNDRERRVIERLLPALRAELGEDLLAVWLFGSRARGEADPTETDPDRRSDIDLMVIAEGGKARHREKVHELVYGISVQEGDTPAWYSVIVEDPGWLRGRRQIRSFFVGEIDRDKIVLAGSGLEGGGLE
jgi:predicted nucleotidyltransferase